MFNAALILIFAFSFVAGRSTNLECSKQLSSAKASSKFAGSVAHGIHSMTVDELKKFYPQATELNFVPTINRDLQADQAILLYAPDVKNHLDQSLYDTEGMKTLDTVLLNMDNKFWDVRNFSPLERVVHAFHMKEVWAKTLKQFQNVKTNSPSNATCECAMDIGYNGIMNIMKYLALVIREPSLVLGNPSFANFNWNANVYSYHFNAAMATNHTVDYETEIKKDPMPRLTDANSWKIWRMKLPTEEENYDLALFLYCAAKKANGI